MTTKPTQSHPKNCLESEQNKNMNDHERAAEAHKAAAEAHERAAENLCLELTKLAHAATHEASIAGGPPRRRVLCLTGSPPGFVPAGGPSSPSP